MTKAESVKEELDNVEYQNNLSNFEAASISEVDSQTKTLNVDTKEEIGRDNVPATKINPYYNLKVAP